MKKLPGKFGLKSVLFLSFLLLAILCKPDFSQAYELRIISRGEPVPEFSLPQINGGNEYNFKTNQGKPAALFFFSITPEFRKKRALALLAELGSLSAHNKNQIDIVGIFSDDQKKETVIDYLKTLSAPIPVLNDADMTVYNKLGVFMMPLVVLVTNEGRFHEVIPYTHGIKELIQAHINFLLGKWDEAQLKKELVPKKNIELSKEEKEYIRRVNYGRILASKKMNSQALREFNKAMKLMPKNSTAFSEAGFVHLAGKKWATAEALFSTALDLEKDSDDALAGIGLALYGQGKTEEALPKLEDAFISPEPKLEVILALAEIYEKKGTYSKAIRLQKLAVSRLMILYGQRWK